MGSYSNSILERITDSAYDASRSLFYLALAISASVMISGKVHADLTNGDFEQPETTGGFYQNINASTMPGWSTSASDNLIELWEGTGEDGGTTFAPFTGNQFVELNANEASTLFQEVDATSAGIVSGSRLHFGFAHRGRRGVDTMELTITDLGVDNDFDTAGNNTTLFQKQYVADRNEWVFNTDSGEQEILALGNNLRFSYRAVSTATGDDTIGNLIDRASFGLNPPSIPEPSSVAILGLAGLGMVMRRRRQG